MRTKALLAMAAILFLTLRSNAQVPEPVADNLLRLEGTDSVSGIHYVKLISLLRTPDAPGVQAGDVPRFTMECREQNGKRSLHWLVRFDGSSDFAFQRPLTSTSSEPNPTPNPSVTLRMRFEGYIKSEEFKRQWEVLPTGELRYRNPGIGSTNLDDPRHFTQWLNSLPSIRLAYARQRVAGPTELLFPLKPLLDEARKAHFCE
jgi:hypothetical protein